jgi:antitoxin (DNA-binding transcriptional repressor) of toxin-antitoxin stability system
LKLFGESSELLAHPSPAGEAGVQAFKHYAARSSQPLSLCLICPDGKMRLISIWTQLGASKMATKTIDIREAQTQLNELLSLALQGTEIIFARDNTPLARLIPVSGTTSQSRIAGLHKGSISISDDFDDPLPDTFWLGAT